MTLHLKWGVVDLKQVREGGWGFLIGNGDPLGYVTVARLEVARG